MKKLFFSFLTLAVVSPAFGSTARYYKFSELAKLSADELAVFNSTLAQTLNTLQSCSEESRGEFNFGNTLHSLAYSANRNGNETFRFEASGQRPAPSFRKFDVIITIESKIVPRKGPVPADAPPERTYDCKTEFK
jgi:hypothetical protein